MVGWHHQLNGHKFEQTLGDSVGWGSLVFCSPWGHKEWDTTEQLNNSSNLFLQTIQVILMPSEAQEPLFFISLSWPYVQYRIHHVTFHLYLYIMSFSAS